VGVVVFRGGAGGDAAAPVARQVLASVFQKG
jgi:cell division protein FtsI/penicillin-binding protein 2